MSIIPLPANVLVEELVWGQLRNDVASRSMFGSQTIQLSEPWWTAKITFAPVNDSTADDLYGLIMSLEGQKNQLALWNISRPLPLGSMRGSPVLSSAVIAGASTLPITGGTPGGTLRIGDMLGIGSGLTQQVVMVQAPIVLNGSGAGTVSILPLLRNPFGISTVVVYDKPKVLFRRVDAKTEWSYTTINVSGFGMDLVEDPRT